MGATLNTTTGSINRMAGRLESSTRLLVLTGALLAGILLLVRLGPQDIGWDHRVYCAALTAMDNGVDPYPVENLRQYGGEQLPYSYPPLAAKLFWPTCQLGEYGYVFADFGLLLLTFVLLLPRGRDRGFLLILLVSGYLALSWNIATGNTGILELLLLAALFRLIRSGRYNLPMVLIGVVGFIKIVPLAFSLGALFVDRSAPLQQRALRALIPLATAALLFCISQALYPAFGESYFRQLSGEILNRHSAIQETDAGPSNAALWPVIGRLSDMAPLPSLAQRGIGLACVSLFGGAMAALFVRLARRKRDIEDARLLSILFLVVLALLPRLKPYSYVYAIIPTWILFKDRSPLAKAVLLACISAGPLLATGENRISVPILNLLVGNLQFFSLAAVAWHTLIWENSTEGQPAQAVRGRESGPHPELIPGGGARELDEVPALRSA